MPPTSFLEQRSLLWSSTFSSTLCLSEVSGNSFPLFMGARSISGQGQGESPYQRAETDGGCMETEFLVLAAFLPPVRSRVALSFPFLLLLPLFLANAHISKALTTTTASVTH